MSATSEARVPVPAATRTDVDAAIDFIGGVAGGTACVYIGQPLDTVKVKLQTFPELYKNALDCFLRTFRQEGIMRGLYAGTVPSLAAQIAENSILFMAYGVCQKFVTNMVRKRDVSELNPLENATSGFLAAFFSSLALCPTELVKCRLQAMAQMQQTNKVEGGSIATGVKPSRIGPWFITRQILREDGVRGLFRGLVPTFAREMPGYFFFFGGYELCRYVLTPPGKTKDEIGALRTVVCGGMGGVFLWVAIFPADVIKSRVQIQTTKVGEKKVSFIQMLSTIRKNEGIRALYKGLGPTVLRTFPATGGLFLAYETTKKTLSNLAYGHRHDD